ALDRPLAERLPGAHELVLAPLLHRPDAEGVDAHAAIVADGPAGSMPPARPAARRTVPALRRLGATRSSTCRPSGAAPPGRGLPSARARRGSARPPAPR